MPTDIWGLLGQGIVQTLYMVLTSTLCAYVLGIPIGVILYITDKTGICPNRWLNARWKWENNYIYKSSTKIS